MESLTKDIERIQIKQSLSFWVAGLGFFCIFFGFNILKDIVIGGLGIILTIVGLLAFYYYDRRIKKLINPDP